MSELALIPHEIASHPDLDFPCPHCGVELTTSMEDHWLNVAESAYMSLTTEYQRQRELEHVQIYASCPSCFKTFQLGVEPVVSYRAKATKLGANARVMGGCNRIIYFGSRGTETPAVSQPNLKLEAQP